MSVKRWFKLIVTLGTGVIVAFLALLTYAAGHGACPECGHTRNLHGCRHCHRIMCRICWGKYSACPGCGMKK